MTKEIQKSKSIAYRVFKQTKEYLDTLPCDLLKRLELKKIYKESSRVNRLDEYNNHILADYFDKWVEEIDWEIAAIQKYGTNIPLVIEAY